MTPTDENVCPPIVWYAMLAELVYIGALGIGRNVRIIDCHVASVSGIVKGAAASYTVRGVLHEPQTPIHACGDTFLMVL